MQNYDTSIECAIKIFYDTLSEKDKRRYAAVETLKLGYGGITYISRILGCSEKTISQGIKELEGLPDSDEYKCRIRNYGGGRKQYSEVIEDIDNKFLEVLKEHTAGDPDNEKVVWTNLTKQEIANKLSKKYGIKVSKTVIRKLFKKHNYRKRKAQKNKTMKKVKNRNEQFENIAKLKSEYGASGNPIISIDTKKREFLGDFYRDGYLYTQEVIEVYDHDFNSFANGVAIPQGIYDLNRTFACWLNH